MRYSAAKSWCNQPHGAAILTDGLNSLESVYLCLLHSEKDLNSEETDNTKRESPIRTPNSASSTNAEFSFQNTNLNQYIEIKHESILFKLKAQLVSERNMFNELFQNKSMLNSNMSTSSFWCKNSSNFPLLNKLSQVLLNIPASSAYIERYFSICGIVFDKKRMNMNPELLRMRSMIKANIKILDQMSNFDYFQSLN